MWCGVIATVGDVCEKAHGHYVHKKDKTHRFHMMLFRISTAFSFNSTQVELNQLNSTQLNSPFGYLPLHNSSKAGAAQNSHNKLHRNAANTSIPHRTIRNNPNSTNICQMVRFQIYSGQRLLQLPGVSMLQLMLTPMMGWCLCRDWMCSYRSAEEMLKRCSFSAFWLE